MDIHDVQLADTADTITFCVALIVVVLVDHRDNFLLRHVLGR